MIYVLATELLRTHEIALSRILIKARYTFYNVLFFTCRVMINQQNRDFRFIY